MPDPPGSPETTDMDTTWVKLHWDRPLKDGGSPIIGYHIEFREPSSQRWMLANPVPAKDPHFIGI